MHALLLFLSHANMHGASLFTNTVYAPTAFPSLGLEYKFQFLFTTESKKEEKITQEQDE